MDGKYMICPLLNLKRLFLDETDAFLYPKCDGQMRIIAFNEDHKVIDRIIAHLKLTYEAERPPHTVQQDLLTGAEEKGKNF